MKKLLSILTITTLTASIPAPLLANTTLERTKRDVGTIDKYVTTGFDIKIKEKLNKGEEVKADKKGYFVVWRGDENSDGRIAKFKNDKSPLINIDSFNNRGVLTYDIGFASKDMDVFIENQTGIIKDMVNGRKDKGNYFKSVYCGNGDNEPNIPFISPKTGQITDWKQPTKNDFQQGISFSLADVSKTATWSNVGMRLTVDGENKHQYQ